MIKTNKLLLAGLAALCFSCGANSSKKVNNTKDKQYKYASVKDDVIHLDLKSAIKDSTIVNLSEICDSLIYIPLESNEKCIIGESKDIKFITDDEFIFLEDRGNLYKFNMSGKFLLQFGKKGRGPKEYECSTFCIDRKNKRVYANAGSKGRLMQFNYNGKLISEDVKFPLGQIEYISSSNTIVTPGFFKLGEKDSLDFSCLTEIDLNGNIKSKLISKIYPLTPKDGAPKFGLEFPGADIYKYDNKIYYHEVRNDTIFSKTEKGRKAHIILNNKEFRKGLASWQFDGMTAGNKFSIKLGETTWMSDYFTVKNETDKYIFAETISNAFIFDKEIGTLVCARCFKEDEKKKFFYNDFDNVNHFNKVEITNNKYITEAIEAIDIIESVEQLKDNKKTNTSYYKILNNVANSITEESNPVLILGHLKR